MFLKIKNNYLETKNIILFLFFAFLIVGSGQHNKKLLLLFFIYLLFTRFEAINKVVSSFKTHLPLWIVIIWCFISSAWSEWPVSSIYTASTQVLLLCTCIVITQVFTFKEITISLKSAGSLFLIINLFYFILFPGSSFSTIGAVGITGHKNAFGFLSAISLIFLIASYKYTPSVFKRTDWFLMMLASIFIIISQSATSILVVFVSLLVGYFVAGLRFSITYHLGCILKRCSPAVIFAIFSLLYLYQYELLTYLYYVYDDGFLTGRGRIWMTLILDNSEYIYRGLGFGSVWGRGDYSAIYFTDIYITDPIWAEGLSASDGGYVDLLLSIGLIGTALFFYFVLSVLSNILIYSYRDEIFLLVVLFFFILLHNITETSFLLSSVNIWFLFVLISCLVAGRGADSTTTKLLSKES